jgi:hypothetical protein
MEGDAPPAVGMGVAMRVTHAVIGKVQPGSSNGGRGAVVEVHLSPPVPGRLEAALAMCAKVCEFAEANGAVNARTFQLSYAGMLSGVWGESWETADWLVSGRLGTAWMSDPTGLEIQTRSLGVDSPSTQVSSAVYQDIPL